MKSNSALKIVHLHLGNKWHQHCNSSIKKKKAVFSAFKDNGCKIKNLKYFKQQFFDAHKFLKSQGKNEKISLVFTAHSEILQDKTFSLHKENKV